VTQADIARAIRALRDAGVPVERVRVRLDRDGVVVDAGALDRDHAQALAGATTAVGERKVIAL
jgi:hypothetical protein